ncbi:TPA: hypothetical protein H1016_04925 [archaeon]|uniref:Uncharacterized protein n=1 Tax=Candidatus Naiadarchaeum limnaeum TaxID=2756139 RepID=A0A832UP72_9ARCH|nr:hypothetical protein [Candidatus Naiadarchaeum limnaeum]
MGAQFPVGVRIRHCKVSLDFCHIEVIQGLVLKEVFSENDLSGELIPVTGKIEIERRFVEPFWDNIRHPSRNLRAFIHKHERHDDKYEIDFLRDPIAIFFKISKKVEGGLLRRTEKVIGRVLIGSTEVGDIELQK